MAPVVQVLKQAWWAPLAALLALIELLMVPGFAFGDDNAVAAALALAGALLLAAGLWKRPQARGLGNVLIVLGAAWAALWFWTLVLPVLAIIVVVGVVTGEMRSRRPMPAAETS
jgi:hypothetical protein